MVLVQVESRGEVVLHVRRDLSLALFRLPLASLSNHIHVGLSSLRHIIFLQVKKTPYPQGSEEPLTQIQWAHSIEIPCNWLKLKGQSISFRV